jgi:hypothetical protein
MFESVQGERNKTINNSKNETFAPKLYQSECQWYHLKACLKSFTMSTNVEGF